MRDFFAIAIKAGIGGGLLIILLDLLQFLYYILTGMQDAPPVPIASGAVAGTIIEMFFLAIFILSAGKVCIDIAPLRIFIALFLSLGFVIACTGALGARRSCRQGMGQGRAVAMAAIAGIVTCFIVVAENLIIFAARQDGSAFLSIVFCALPFLAVCGLLGAIGGAAYSLSARLMKDWHRDGQSRMR